MRNEFFFSICVVTECNQERRPFGETDLLPTRMGRPKKRKKKNLIRVVSQKDSLAQIQTLNWGPESRNPEVWSLGPYSEIKQ